MARAKVSRVLRLVRKRPLQPTSAQTLLIEIKLQKQCISMEKISNIGNGAPVRHRAMERTSARAESYLMWPSCEPGLVSRNGSVPHRSGEQRKTHEISCYEWAEHQYAWRS